MSACSTWKRITLAMKLTDIVRHVAGGEHVSGFYFAHPDSPTYFQQSANSAAIKSRTTHAARECRARTPRSGSRPTWHTPRWPPAPAAAKLLAGRCQVEWGTFRAIGALTFPLLSSGITVRSTGCRQGGMFECSRFRVRACWSLSFSLPRWWLRLRRGCHHQLRRRIVDAANGEPPRRIRTMA